MIGKSVTARASAPAVANDNVAERFDDRRPRPLGVLPDAGATALGMASVPRLRWRPETVSRVLWVVFLLLVLTQVTAAFVVISPAIQAVLVMARRVIWLVILAATVLESLRSEPSDLLGPLTAFVPFFLVGLGSALFGVEPLAGLVELSFWLITVLGACVLGKQFRGRDLPTAMVAWFILVLGASVLLALVKPKLAVDIDSRTIGGAWRGVFPGKNWLAWYSGFGLLLAVYARAVRLPARIVLGLVSLACLHATHSGGGIVAMAAVLGIMAMFALWRRLGLSAGLQVLVNSLIAGFVLVAGAVGYQAILTAMGRDATLTGRTFIWQAYFGRALDSWLIGAGPGSFTELSMTTQDIGLRYQWSGKIFTPHNMFLAAFGEVGLVGLIAFVVPLAAIAFGYRARQGDRNRHLLPAFALFFLISGLDETHEVFGVSAGLFLIVLLRAWQWPARTSPGREALHVGI
jgi:exopolysaccharide production protein ExoQ